MKIFNMKIELHSIVRDLIKNIFIIFMAALIGLMGVYIVTRNIYTPEYTSTATVVVNAKNSSTGSYSLFSVSVEMTEIISKVLVEPIMKEKAIELIGVDSFDGELTANVHKGTNFINLSVTSDSPQNSYILLDAVLKAYPEISDSVFENVVISVLSTPKVPSAPSNSISTGNRLLIAGICAGIIAAFVVVLSIMRDTVKDEYDFKEKIDSKLLGIVPHEKKIFSIKERLQKKNKALLIHNNAFISLKFIENYHKIAAKIEHIHRSNGAKVFVVTSVAENEGKSTTASNIAISLADRGHSVVLIDVDCKKPALYKIFNKKFSEQSEFGYLMNGKLKSQDFVFKKYKQSSLYLALNTSPYENYGEWIETGKLANVVDTLKNQVDYVILDSAPLSADAYVTDIAKIADQTVIVVRTDMAYTVDINDTIATINEVGGTIAGCVLNDVYPDFKIAVFTGTDESGYYYGKGYGRYGKYGKYEKYGRYSNYYLNDYSEEDENDED